MTANADVIAAVQGKFPSAAPRPGSDHTALNIPAGEAVALLTHLRDGMGLDFLVDVTAVDWSAEASPRFSVVWHLYSSTGHEYVRVVADCADDKEPSMPSVTRLWAAADWHERETYDLMGVRFEGHPDLRRILMWPGYPYFPLRKEFPLGGLPAELPDPEVVEQTGTPVITAPMAGGPFVAKPGLHMGEAEPRAKDESWNEKTEKPS